MNDIIEVIYRYEFLYDKAENKTMQVSPDINILALKMGILDEYYGDGNYYTLKHKNRILLLSNNLNDYDYKESEVILIYKVNKFNRINIQTQDFNIYTYINLRPDEGLKEIQEYFYNIYKCNFKIQDKPNTEKTDHKTVFNDDDSIYIEKIDTFKIRKIEKQDAVKYIYAPDNISCKNFYILVKTLINDKDINIKDFDKYSNKEIGSISKFTLLHNNKISIQRNKITGKLIYGYNFDENVDRFNYAKGTGFEGLINNNILAKDWKLAKTYTDYDYLLYTLSLKYPVILYNCLTDDLDYEIKKPHLQSLINKYHSLNLDQYFCFIIFEENHIFPIFVNFNKADIVVLDALHASVKIEDKDTVSYITTVYNKEYYIYKNDSYPIFLKNLSHKYSNDFLNIKNIEEFLSKYDGIYKVLKNLNSYKNKNIDSSFITDYAFCILNTYNLYANNNQIRYIYNDNVYNNENELKFEYDGSNFKYTENGKELIKIKEGDKFSDNLLNILEERYNIYMSQLNIYKKSYDTLKLYDKYNYTENLKYTYISEYFIYIYRYLQLCPDVTNVNINYFNNTERLQTNEGSCGVITMQILETFYKYMNGKSVPQTIDLIIPEITKIEKILSENKENEVKNVVKDLLKIDNIQEEILYGQKYY